MIEDRDLAEFAGSFLQSISVARGSIGLVFSRDAHLLVQCPFDLTTSAGRVAGHGEIAQSATPLFALLNADVDTARLLDEQIFLLSFGKHGDLRLLPEPNGYESYVVSTQFGIVPILRDLS